MLSLAHLPAPPSMEQVTACETDGSLRAISPPSAAYSVAKQLLGDQTVDIALAPDVARPAHSKHEAKDAFCAYTETPCQKVMSAYHEEGLEAAIKEYVNIECIQSQEGSVKQSLARIALKVLSFINKIQAYLPLQIYSPTRTIDYKINTLAQDRLRTISGGGSCLVLKLDWHPHTCTVAVLTADDSIRVFGTGRSLSPLLKHRAQKHVSQLAWMPYSASILAVACEGGVLVWTLDPTSVVTRPSGSCLSQLAHPSATPTVSLSWHPKGTKLACVGDKGHSIVVWDVGMETSTVVHTSFTGCINEVIWSPDGSRLLASTSTKVIKIFETKKWTYERWTLESLLQSAVWSQSGNILLFSTVMEPAIYCLKFTPGENVGGSQVASQVADLSSILTTTEDGEEITIGGPVHQLSWDPSNERLVVVFRNSEYIALLHTRSYPQLHLAPGGFIHGESGNIAMKAHFQNSVNNGAVLSIIWSHSPIRHIPLHFTSMGPAVSAAASLDTTRQLNQSILNYSLYQASTLMSPTHNYSNVDPNTSLTYPIAGLFTSP